MTLGQNGKDASIYQRNAPWPSDPVRIESRGLAGKYRLVRLSFSPFVWNPVHRRLTANTRVSVRLHWDRRSVPPGRFVNELMQPTPFPSSGKIVNRLNLSWYRLLDGSSRPQDLDYLIVTTRAVGDGSARLEDFTEHKQTRGFRVTTA